MWGEGGFPTMVGQLALGVPKKGLVGVKGAASRRRQSDLDFVDGQACVILIDGEPTLLVPS